MTALAPKVAPTPKAATTKAGSAQTRIGRTQDHAEVRADALAAKALSGDPPPPGIPLGAPPPRGARLPFGPGQPLSPIDRAYFEPRFQRDLSTVRIHNSRPALLAARALGAQGFALDNHLVFGGQAERGLMAHELAHVADGERDIIRRRDLKQAAFTSTIHPKEVDALSDTELAVLHRFLEQNADHAALDDPGFKANFQVVREAMIRRSAKKGQPPKPAPAKKSPLPAFGGQGEVASLTALMQSVNNIRQIGSDLHEVVWEGVPRHIHDADVAKLRKAAADALRSGTQKTDDKATSAKGFYETQSGINKKFWPIASVVAWLGDIEDPGPVLLGLVQNASALSAAARKAIEKGDYVGAARLLSQAEIQAAQAQKMAHTFWEKTITTGEWTVSTLEVVRDVSFAFVAIAAVVISGGAVLGVGGMTTAMASSAGLVATITPVAASLSEGLAKAAMGDKVDWGSIAVDAAVAAIMYRFGGPLANKLGGGMSAALFKQAGKTLPKQVIVNAIAGVIVGKGSAIIHAAVRRIVEDKNGRPDKWEGFVDQVVKDVLLDPKALFFDAVGVALGLGHAAKLKAGASPSPATTGSPPKSATAADPDLGAKAAPAAPAKPSVTPEQPKPQPTNPAAKTEPVTAPPPPQPEPPKIAPANEGTPAFNKPKSKPTSSKSSPAAPGDPKIEEKPPDAKPASAAADPKSPAPAKKDDPFDWHPDDVVAGIGANDTAPKSPPPAAAPTKKPKPSTKGAPKVDNTEKTLPITAATRIESKGAWATAKASPAAHAELEKSAESKTLDSAHAAADAKVATATAQTPKSITTGPRAQAAEMTAYDARLARKEIGVLAPVGANVTGADYVTAVALPDGKYELQIGDTKSRVSKKSFGAKKTELPDSWRDAVDGAIKRLDLPDPKMEQGIREAWEAKRFRLVRDTVDYSPSGQGALKLDN